MLSRFAKNIAPSVIRQIVLAQRARQRQDQQCEFFHLENAHVLGQESTYWHLRVHSLMLGWALRNKDAREAMGQVLRIIGAALCTAIGWVPRGNRGGSNVSPFAPMNITPEQARIIYQAKNKH